MRKIIWTLVGIIILIGVISSLDFFVDAVLRSLIFIAVLGVIGYLIYYFFILTDSQRKYKRALRKSKRKYQKKHRK